jgi:hypothetical protein
MPRANRHFLPGHVWHITHPSGDEFQSFQWFDGLTMSGLILNRFAPFQTFWLITSEGLSPFAPTHNQFVQS